MPIAQTAASMSGMLASMMPAPPRIMMPISASLMIRISRDLSWSSASWPDERREQEEGQDEEALRDRAELELLRRVRIELIGDEQHDRLLEQAVVERAEELRREQRQETPRAQQVGDVLDQGMGARLPWTERSA